MSFPFAHTNPPLRLLAVFQDHFPDQTPLYILQVPDREMWVAASTSTEVAYTIIAPDLNGRTTFNERTAKARRTVTNRPLPKWARYPAGTIVALTEAGLVVPGFAAVIVGEEPLGPRYDHALGMAVATLVYEVHQRAYTTDGLIELIDCVRRDYIEA